MLVDVCINHENTGKNDSAAQPIGTTAEGDEMQKTRFEWVLKNTRKK